MSHLPSPAWYQLKVAEKERPGLRIGWKPLWQEGLEGERLEGEHGAELGDVDFLSDAVLRAREEGGDDAVGEEQRAGLIGEAPGGGDRALAGSAAERDHGAGHALGDDIEGAARGPFALGSEAGVGRVDELWVDLLEVVVAEADRVEVAGAEVFGEDVGVLDQLVDDLDRALGAEVEGHGALAPVERLEVGAEAVGADAELAAGVAVAGHFDLEHIGAHVGEHGGGVGAVLVAGEVDDADSFKRRGHDQAPSGAGARIRARYLIAGRRSATRRLRGLGGQVFSRNFFFGVQGRISSVLRGFQAFKVVRFVQVCSATFSLVQRIQGWLNE